MEIGMNTRHNANWKNHCISVACPSRHWQRSLELAIYLDEENLITGHNFSTLFSIESIFNYDYYAAKALSYYMFWAFRELGLSVDVVSEGELYYSREGRYSTGENLSHGNNKLREAHVALNYRVGRIIIDHPTEFSVIIWPLPGRQQKIDFISINPGIQATTHEYIQTTTDDSKFGMNTADPDIFAWFRNRCRPYLDLKGVHCQHRVSNTDKTFCWRSWGKYVFLSVKTKLNMQYVGSESGGRFRCVLHGR